MKCKRQSCVSPLACGVYGYCRYRNIEAGRMPKDDAERAEWQRLDNEKEPDK